MAASRGKMCVYAIRQRPVVSPKFRRTGHSATFPCKCHAVFGQIWAQLCSDTLKKASHELRKLMRSYKTIFFRFCKVTPKTALLRAFGLFRHQSLHAVAHHCIALSPNFALCNLNLHCRPSLSFASIDSCRQLLYLWRQETRIAFPACALFLSQPCSQTLHDTGVIKFCINPYAPRKSWFGIMRMPPFDLLSMRQLLKKSYFCQ